LTPCARASYGDPVRRILVLLACLSLLASVSAADARADYARGRPGALLAVASVVGSHYNPCAPGGLRFDVPVVGYPCWQAYLGSTASPTVGRSPRLPGKAQLVTLTRSIYRQWLPSDPVTLALQRSVTRRIGPRTRAVRFPAWSEVTSAGFGYQTVLYTLVWRSARTRAVVGVRIHVARNYRCQTNFPCATGSQWIWLGDTG
jgi:hypothetical protein